MSALEGWRAFNFSNNGTSIAAMPLVLEESANLLAGIVGSVAEGVITSVVDAWQKMPSLPQLPSMLPIASAQELPNLSQERYHQLREKFEGMPRETQPAEIMELIGIAKHLRGQIRWNPRNYSDKGVVSKVLSIVDTRVNERIDEMEYFSVNLHEQAQFYKDQAPGLMRKVKHAVGWLKKAKEAEAIVQELKSKLVSEDKLLAPDLNEKLQEWIDTEGLERLFTNDYVFPICAALVFVPFVLVGDDNLLRGLCAFVLFYFITSFVNRHNLFNKN